MAGEREFDKDETDADRAEDAKKGDFWQSERDKWESLANNQLVDTQLLGIVADASYMPGEGYHPEDSQAEEAHLAQQRADWEARGRPSFVDDCVRTEAPITDELRARLMAQRTIRLLHSGIGLATEGGEFLDNLKKHIYYGKPFDVVNAQEELGDALWYIGLACAEFDIELVVLLDLVINKLRKRYPEKFTKEAALVRDLVAERAVLEGEKVVKPHTYDVWFEEEGPYIYVKDNENANSVLCYDRSHPELGWERCRRIRLIDMANAVRLSRLKHTASEMFFASPCGYNIPRP